MNYFRFMNENWRFVGFGFFMSLSSSFGQTFYIALSGAEIRLEFGMTHGEFGFWFGVATIGSALSLIWLGRLIDYMDLRFYSLATCVGMILSMLIIASAPGLFTLVVGLYLARLCGQGLMTHISVTSMGRYFNFNRGKAVSIALMGQSLGEAILPTIVITFIIYLGWLDTWYVAAIFLGVTSVILVPYLMRGYSKIHLSYIKKQSIGTDTPSLTGKQWTRIEVLFDHRFYLIAAAVLSFSFIGTGLFFHQIHIASEKNWPLEILASAFVLYALFKVITALLVGPLIDKFGCRPFLPLMLIPLAFTLIALAFFDSIYVAFILFALLGISIGVLMPFTGAIWPQLYGTVHLGEIRSMMAALVAFSSAISPAIFGVMLDTGLTIEALSVVCLIYVIIITFLVSWVFVFSSRGSIGY